jgi:hypothetical protein
MKEEEVGVDEERRESGSFEFREEIKSRRDKAKLAKF